MAILSGRRGWPAAFAAGLAGLAMLGATARGEVSREYQIKAAFLYNFVQFVEWPQDAFARPDAPLTIAPPSEDPPTAPQRTGPRNRTVTIPKDYYETNSCVEIR